LKIISETQIASGNRVGSRDRVFRILILVLGLGHLTIASVQGLRWEHVAADGLILILPWIGPRSLAFAKAALPLWITGVLVDNQRYLPLLGPIHSDDIRRWEMTLFRAGGVSWPEWLDAHPTAILDFLCGLAYAIYLFEFFAAEAFLYFRSDRRRFAALAWAFFAANVIGILVYVFFPVAPPWYVIEHGLGPVNPHTAASAAGCARFDALLGIHYFSSFYSRNPNVFGAMPSLHVCYPVLVAWYTWNRGWKWRVGTVAFALWVSLAAVYLAHHYVVDVIAGALVASPCCLWASKVTGLRGGTAVDLRPSSTDD
jgi:membrane-associated phospholipid phosphatase